MSIYLINKLDNYSKYLAPVKREFESKALSEIFILDINKLADSIKTKPFNEYFDEKENQLYFNVSQTSLQDIF